MVKFGKRTNKKGSVLDLLALGVILLFVAVVVLVGFMLTSKINDTIQSSIVFPTEAKTASTQLTSYYPGIIDKSFLLLAVGLAIVTLILAASVRVSPIFFPFYIMALVILIYLSGVFSNIYQTMAADATLSTYASQLMVISQILNYLPLITGIFGTILAFVMFKSWNEVR